MRCEFVVDVLTIWGLRKKGDVVEVDDVTAKDWLASGYVREPAKRKKSKKAEKSNCISVDTSADVQAAESDPEQPEADQPEPEAV